MDAPEPEDDNGLEEVRRLPALGSLLSVLFAAERRDVQKAIAAGVKGANPGSTGQCLEYLLQYVKQEGTVVHICVPLLQHIVKSKESSSRKKSLLILRWLLGRDESWMAIANTLSHIISSSDYDHTTKFGACLAIKEFVNTDTNPISELTFRRSILIFATCVPHLVEQVCHASCINGKQKLPTRLSLAAADCILMITMVLAVGVLNNDGEESWDITLWNQLDNIITLVSELCEWNHSTRPLHARGLTEVGRHLQEIRGTYEGERTIGIVALKSCWQDYASLICSEDLKNISKPDRLRKLMLALKHFSGNRSSRKMRRFILTCLALFLGCLDAESLGSDPKSKLLELLIRQLFSNEEESVDLVVSILKFALSEGNGFIHERESFLPLFMELLETRVTMPNAFVPLAAEYFSKHPSPDLERLFQLLDAETAAQRRNALDVIDELVKQSSDSVSSKKGSLRRSITSILLKRLEDEELINRIASPLFATFDSVSIIPELVQRLHDSSEKVRSGASTALISAMKSAVNQKAVVSILFDCTGNLSQQADVERVMGLIPLWASTVKDWDELAVFILNKMFADPSNSLFPRFLSEIATYWVDIYHVVFNRVLRAMLECNSTNPIQEDDQDMLHQHLFRKLSPLLVLRVLPLRTYDHVDCKELYSAPQAMCQGHSITSLLVNWMCGPSEFDDVRRLAAELCGHLLPEAVLPFVTDQLKEATQNGYILKLKSCIYAICNSLMIRGHQTLSNPLMRQTKALLATVLLWPTLSEEVQKAQHGCIDGFAVMIRADLDSGYDGVLQAVISCLQDQPYSIPSLCDMSTSEFSNCAAAGQDVDSYTAVPLSFRVCMANVLISCCSKIKDSSHEHFTRIVVPAILSLLQSEREAIIRVACTQLLFSAVYNVKAASMGLYANDLLTVSLATLKDKKLLHEERLAGTKLLAVLLVHEDILKEIRPSLHHVQQVLTSMDPDPEVRKLCEQLLTCLSS